ncbi:hypothetical protein ACLOJK_028248 [Asimina triloba]
MGQLANAELALAIALLEVIEAYMRLIRENEGKLPTRILLVLLMQAMWSKEDEFVAARRAQEVVGDEAVRAWETSSGSEVLKAELEVARLELFQLKLAQESLAWAPPAVAVESTLLKEKLTLTKVAVAKVAFLWEETTSAKATEVVAKRELLARVKELEATLAKLNAAQSLVAVVEERVRKFEVWFRE